MHSGEPSEDQLSGRELHRTHRDRGGVLPEGAVPYFRERLYATFTGLAIVRVVSGSEHVEPRHAFLALMFGVLGIVIAGTVSEIVAHLMVHRSVPHGAEFRVMFRAALGGLATAILPLLLIGAAWLGWMPIHLALRISAALYLVTLIGVGWLAVRRSTLGLGAKALVLVALAGLGVLVVLIQQLAKSV